MSWILGTDTTSFSTDLKSLWHNATTGELTPEQKQEIAVNSTQAYTPCAQNPNSPECQQLLQSQIDLVNIVAPTTDCKLRLSNNFCFQSWGTVSLAVVGVIFAMVLIYGVVTSLIVRGK